MSTPVIPYKVYINPWRVSVYVHDGHKWCTQVRPRFLNILQIQRKTYRNAKIQRIGIPEICAVHGAQDNNDIRR